ncbi:MAG TPA: phosphoglycerate kinase [Candidatus Binatia bacterium]|jgi:phosphoglycerate kinase
MIRKLGDVDLNSKAVFLRVDFNVPIADGKVTEPHRIDSALPTIRFIMERARKVIIASHLGRPGGKVVAEYSLAPVRNHLQDSLNKPVVLAPDCIGAATEQMVRADHDRIVLLENLRFHKEEEKNDREFSRALASLAEVYVNDAFGAAHRAHASISAMTEFFSVKAAGKLMQKELDYLGPMLTAPDQPFVMILGGAKVSDKIGLIKNLLPKVTALLIGGGMAYTFLKSQGIEVGRSLVEEDKLSLAAELVAEASRRSIKLVLPIDHVTADTEKKNPQPAESRIMPDRMGLDIGPKTSALFVNEIKNAKLVLWNGPVGLFEVPPYDQGSRTIAKSLAENHPRVTSVIAGGDTVAAVGAAGVAEKVSHLSTGGGATLEFLEGRELPGIKALQDDA